MNPSVYNNGIIAGQARILLPYEPKNRELYFGEIANGQMDHSTIEVIAYILWFEIKNRAKNMELGALVVMPNYKHGILILNEVEKPVVWIQGIPCIHNNQLVKKDFRIWGKIPFHPSQDPVNRL